MNLKPIRPMKIILAPDSFKGAANAPDVAEAFARGFARVWKGAEYIRLPVADGGEGTVQVIGGAATGAGRGGVIVCPNPVSGPLPDQTVSASWACVGDSGASGCTAVLELAEAAGLTRISRNAQRDPLRATTRGVGEIALQAVRAVPRINRFVFALGGSATTDGGVGLLSALGIRFLDADGRDLPPGGAALVRLMCVDRSGLRLDPAAFDVEIACDVDNPLTGPRGAATIFGPQKGATPSDIALLDAALARLASVLGADGDLPGRGAAGGTAYGLSWLFPHAVFRPGIDVVLDAVAFDEHVRGASLVVTGEGRMDAQTLGGKAALGVARRARALGVPCVALVGALAPDVSPQALADAGIAAVLPLAPGPATLEGSIAHTLQWAENAAERAARFMTLALQPPLRGRGGHSQK